jgi:Holliday junction DNA helicase RuvA
MITYIEGKIIKLNFTDKGDELDVFLPIGIAYRVLTPSGGLEYSLNLEVKLYTSFQVREDSQTLYGFLDEASRDMFERLISVSGIGPKIGIAMLSMFSKAEIQNLINEGEFKELSKVSGLGPKGAKKIIIELQGKLDDLSMDSSVSNQVLKDLKDGLKSLGFSGEQLDEMLQLGENLYKEDNDIDIEILLREVLKQKR